MCLLHIGTEKAVEIVVNQTANESYSIYWFGKSNEAARKTVFMTIFMQYWHSSLIKFVSNKRKPRSVNIVKKCLPKVTGELRSKASVSSCNISFWELLLDPGMKHTVDQC